MILKKVNNEYILDNIHKDKLDIRMFQYVEESINSVIRITNYIHVKNILSLFQLYNENFTFEIDEGINYDDCIRNYIYFDLYCKGDAPNGQEYIIIFKNEKEGAEKDEKTEE